MPASYATSKLNMSSAEAWTASLMSQVYHAGFEISQCRVGHNVGRPIYRGGQVEGTDEAVRAELKETFEKVRGTEGELVRKGMERLHDIVVESRQRGQSAKAMASLGKV